MKIIHVLVIISTLLSITGNVFAQNDLDIQGITSKDKLPNSCVDCHTKDTYTDYRVNAILKNRPNHPDISESVKTIPNDCKKCHKPNTMAGELSDRLHFSHIGNPKENPYIQDMKAGCMGCHTFDNKLGKISFKSIPANW